MMFKTRLLVIPVVFLLQVESKCLCLKCGLSACKKEFIWYLCDGKCGEDRAVNLSSDSAQSVVFL